MREYKYFRKVDGIFLLLILSIVLFIFSHFYNGIINKIISTSTFLAWHNLLEFISIISSFSIFIVTYYTYDSSKKANMLLLGCSFFIIGSLDIFHTLSYQGMPDFFIANATANRATTFWIVSRVTGSLGILVSVFMPADYKFNINKIFFIMFNVIYIILIFDIATYKPEMLPKMYTYGIGMTKFKIILEYAVILILIFTLIKVVEVYLKTGSIREHKFIYGILFCILSEIAFVSYKNVYDIYNYLGHIYKFIAYFVIFESLYTYNVNKPYREMKKARNELRKYSEDLNILVKQRTIELEQINEKLLMDLEYARDIQLSLLPAKMPQLLGVSFGAGYLPAERLSGDFYNVIELDESNIAIYIGDVSGHGVPAAMLTIFANQNLKPVKETDDSIEIISPGFTLKRLYKAFNQANFRDETYLVMVCGIYNIHTRCFTYASAGINVSPLIIKNCGEITEMDVHGFAICKLGDIYVPYYEDRLMQLETGDKILFYTDGLIEAENKNGDKYTYNDLKNVLLSNYHLNSAHLAEVIRGDFFDKIGEENQLKDDVTFLIMEVY